MADIYNRGGTTFKGSFAADAATLTFAGTGVPGVGKGAGGVGLLTQSLQLQYNQQVTRFYEVGAPFTYLIAGRTQGQMGITRVIGPAKLQKEFYTQYGDVCKADKNTINIDVAANCNTAGALNDGAMHYTLSNVVLTSIGMSVSAQDMIINEQLSAMFVSLDLK